MKKNTSLGVVIVNYEKGTQTLENVLGILKQERDFSLSVLVWDNAGKNPENNADRLEEVLKNRFVVEKNFSNNFSKTISKTTSEHAYTGQKMTVDEKTTLFFVKSFQNVGYTKANNEGVHILESENLEKIDIVALINPDIEWKESNTLSVLKNFLEENEEIGVVGPLQMRPDGTRENSVRRFPVFFRQILRRSGIFHWFSDQKFFDEYEDISLHNASEVDWLQSSFWMVKHDEWKKQNGLDEQFFLFLADTDFCKRIWENGKKVVFFPQTVVGCDGIRCSHGHFFAFLFKKTIRIHFWDLLKYLKKWK